MSTYTAWGVYVHAWGLLLITGSNGVHTAVVTGGVEARSQHLQQQYSSTGSLIFDAGWILYNEQFTGCSNPCVNVLLTGRRDVDGVHRVGSALEYQWRSSLPLGVGSFSSRK